MLSQGCHRAFSESNFHLEAQFDKEVPEHPWELVQEGRYRSLKRVVRKSGVRNRFSNKTRGPGEKEAPRNHQQKFRVRNWPIWSADFPMTPMEGTEHDVGPF